MDNEQKAKFYNQLLTEYDKKAALVSAIQSKFDLSKDDIKEMESLKKEMMDIQRKAMSLGSL